MVQKESLISQFFTYDESSLTCLRWNTAGLRGRCRLHGKVAGNVDRHHKRYFLQFGGRQLYVHRIIYEMFHEGFDKSLQVDHFNKDKLDNKISNLRLVSNKINCRNRSRRADNTSGTNGVIRRTSRGVLYWQAHWTDDVGKTHRESFSTKKYGNGGALALAKDVRKHYEIGLKNLGYSKGHGL